MTRLNRLSRLVARAAALARDPQEIGDIMRRRLGLPVTDGAASVDLEGTRILAGLAYQPIETSVRDAIDRYKGGELPTALSRALVTEALRLHRVDVIEAPLLSAFGPACLGLSRRDDVDGIYSVILAFGGNGYRLGVSRDFIGWPFLVDRLFALCAYLERFSQTGIQGELRLCLGDLFEGDEPQLCFSGSQPHHHLIPDPIFLATNGYRAFRAEVAKHWKPWPKRRACAYWRGSLTGIASTYGAIMQLPRVQLALLAQRHPHLDAGITDLSQYGPLLPTLQFVLDGLGTILPREDAIQNIEYRCLIDVDGNSNSWPGLYQKLVCGGTTIKVLSAYRQWYYDRLLPDIHYMPADSVDEIPDKIDACLSLADRSEAIAMRARQFVLGLRPANEYRYFEKAVLQARR